MGMQGTHIAFTVSDLDRSATWYQDLFGGQEVFRGNDGVSDVAIYAIADNVLLGLRRHAGTETGDRFSHERCGLDHFALHVADRTDLEKWQAKFEEKNVALRHRRERFRAPPQLQGSGRDRTRALRPSAAVRKE